MKISSPWVNYYREVQALFGKDPEIKVVYDENENEVKLYVENARKADALTRLLPSEKVFGNVTLKITVVPANDLDESKVVAFEEAFAGNPVLKYVWHADTVMGAFNYAVFKNEVVQYFNDDMSDINGNRSTLYQEIAKDVIGEEPGLFFCTEAANAQLSKPLGEWP